MIRVGVAGAAGRMGETVCTAVEGAGDMELVGRADPLLEVTLVEMVEQSTPEVVVDFTLPDTALENALLCARAGVHAVIGTTGFDLDALGEGLLALQKDAMPPARAGGGPNRAPTSQPANVLVAPNFAIGAVLMMRFAAEAAKHMQKAEIIELHHDRKLDAPSGTAARTAQLMAEASGGAPPPIHSVRLPGIVANQEVILGDEAQTLTIRHDTTGRESFMPGVLLAIRGVRTLQSTPVVGLEHLLFAGA
ncbi:MAG TPA: dihydrodipicolinate reductase C-terminal domain-containing protein [Solirubrobacteraceae bacterium]